MPRIAYYKGCVAGLSARELDVSTKLLAPKLGLELVELESVTCCGAGDIQMADPDYPRRLPALFREYSEAVAFSGLRNGGIASYTDAVDLMRKSRHFYNDYVKRMLNTQWASVHKALTHHFPGGKNLYLEAVEANLKRIDELPALGVSI